MPKLGTQTAVALFSLLLSTAAHAQAAKDYTGVVQGVVSDAKGQPVAGAFVKLKNADRRLTFMVISQDGGTYTANKLPPGNYTVESVGGDFQSKWSQPIAVNEQTPAKLNVALTDRRAPNLPAAWPRRLPEELADKTPLPAGPGKQIIEEHCTSCHSAGQVAINRFDRDAWKSTIEDMRGNMKDANIPDITDKDEGVLLDYLAKSLPPLPAPDENSRFPRTLMQGEARKYRVVEYDLVNKLAETHDIAVDPNGIGWANQRVGGKIGRFDPVTLQYTEIVPPKTTEKRARPGNLQITKNGVIWLADPFETRWLSYDIKAAKWTSYRFPTDKIRGQVQGNTIALHPDGTVWMSGPGSARRLDPKTGAWSAWDTPTWTKTHIDPGGYGMTIDGDGNAWMAENLVDRMARFNGKTGKVDEFKIPYEGTAYPRRMDADPNGDVWVGLWQAGKILHIDHKTGKMTIIDPPIPGNGAYSIDFDNKKDLLWVTLHRVDTIGRFNPKTGEWLLLPMPQAETDTRRVEVDQNRPNRIWFSSVSNQARMGFVELLE